MSEVTKKIDEYLGEMATPTEKSKLTIDGAIKILTFLRQDKWAKTVKKLEHTTLPNIMKKVESDLRKVVNDIYPESKKIKDLDDFISFTKAQIEEENTKANKGIIKGSERKISDRTTVFGNTDKITHEIFKTFESLKSKLTGEKNKEDRMKRQEMGLSTELTPFARRQMEKKQSKMGVSKPLTPDEIKTREIIGKISSLEALSKEINSPEVLKAVEKYKKTPEYRKYLKAAEEPKVKELSKSEAKALKDINLSSNPESLANAVRHLSKNNENPHVAKGWEHIKKLIAIYAAEELTYRYATPENAPALLKHSEYLDSLEPKLLKVIMDVTKGYGISKQTINTKKKPVIKKTAKKSTPKPKTVKATFKGKLG